MRLVSYNVEWFTELFDDEDQLLVDDEPSGREGITRACQIEAVAKVFTALDADGVMVIEAPNAGKKRDTVRALEEFARAFDLRVSRTVLGFANETHQEIALMFDPDRLTARHDPQGEQTGRSGRHGAPRFDGVFRIDIDMDGTEDLISFSKPPLELEVVTAAGTRLRMIGAHLKSKVPNGAHNRDEAMRLSIANRRKQLAQAIWLRRRIESHLAKGEPVILMGDLNDHPGLDEYEELFGRSSVEIIMGDDLYDPNARAALQRPLGAVPSTARFYIDKQEHYLQALLDYVMISPDLMSRRPAWRVWHPLDDARVHAVPELRQALLDASDHFPVVLDIEI